MKVRICVKGFKMCAEQRIDNQMYEELLQVYKKSSKTTFCKGNNLPIT